MTKYRLYEYACSSFGLGYAPIASGTVGSLPAVAVYVVTALLTPPEYHNLILGTALLVSCGVSVALGEWAENFWQAKDPRQFVLDEHAGYYLTVLLFRVDSVLATAVWTFLMTRAFDILKPPPAGRMEHLPAGWGILMDDLIASVYAVAALFALRMYLPKLFMLS